MATKYFALSDTTSSHRSQCDMRRRCNFLNGATAKPVTWNKESAISDGFQRAVSMLSSFFVLFQVSDRKVVCRAVSHPFYLSNRFNETPDSLSDETGTVKRRKTGDSRSSKKNTHAFRAGIHRYRSIARANLCYKWSCTAKSSVRDDTLLPTLSPRCDPPSCRRDVQLLRVYVRSISTRSNYLHRRVNPRWDES